MESSSSPSSPNSTDSTVSSGVCAEPPVDFSSFYASPSKKHVTPLSCVVAQPNYAKKPETKISMSTSTCVRNPLPKSSQQLSPDHSVSSSPNPSFSSQPLTTVISLASHSYSTEHLPLYFPTATASTLFKPVLQISVFASVHSWDP